MSGRDLARAFWHDAVRPLIDELLPGVPRAAALVGTGSEVLGFDDTRSPDHGFGPRVTVFVDDDVAVGGLRSELDARLPAEFGGMPVRFARAEGEAPEHAVDVVARGAWFTEVLGFDPGRGIGTEDWLGAPTQRLREVTAGELYEDTDGWLTGVRDRLAWYPDDIWLYVLACQWRRIDQEEPFVGRTGEVGDELGSAVVAARVVRDHMRLCFLIDRQYAPYSKWLGTAFSRLPSAADVGPPLQAALAATDWREREKALCQAAESVARRFNDLGVVPHQDPSVRPFYTRPFLVLGAGRFAEACMAATPLRELGWRGSIDQWVDSTDVLSGPASRRRGRPRR